MDGFRKNKGIVNLRQPEFASFFEKCGKKTGLFLMQREK
jgi:hypothetical protein